MSNCTEVLLNYLGVLDEGDRHTDNNENSTNPNRPQPLFFTRDNCQGARFPPDLSNVSHTVTNPNKGREIRSMIIPRGWSAKFSPNDQSNVANLPRIPAAGYASYDIVVDSINNTLLPNIRDNAATVFTESEVTLEKWKLDMCMNRIVTTVGIGAMQEGWHMGSKECDSFMLAYCETNPDEIECSCIKEEKQLNTQACASFQGRETLVPNATCTDKEKFQIFLPATCFGTQCSGGAGYRLSYMQNQPCNQTLCEQKINLLGDQIERSGSSTLYCGNANYSVKGDGTRGKKVDISSQTDVKATTVHKDAPDVTGTPISLIVIVMISLFVLFVGFPLTYVIYKRRKQNQSISSSGST